MTHHCVPGFKAARPNINRTFVFGHKFICILSLYLSRPIQISQLDHPQRHEPIATAAAAGSHHGCGARSGSDRSGRFAADADEQPIDADGDSQDSRILCHQRNADADP